MYFREFDTEEVKAAIEDMAQVCADDDEWCEGVDMWTRVHEKAGDWLCYPIDHIRLCAHYAPNDAATGYESFEDTPVAQFENDIYDRAIEIRGYEDE